MWRGTGHGVFAVCDAIGRRLTAGGRKGHGHRWGARTPVHGTLSGRRGVGTGVVVIGDIACDLLVRTRAPLAFGADTRAHTSPQPGGAGANTAAWLARLGVETHLVGRVGRDVFGQFLTHELRRDGVVLHVGEDPSHPTGQIVVVVDPTGERSMLTDRGANSHLRREDLPTGLFGTAQHLHLSGYAFLDDGPRAAALDALRLARARGMTTSIDPASATVLADLGPRRFLQWTAGIDVCFPNHEEGALLAGTGEPAAIAATLSNHYPGVVLTLGAEGAIYAAAGQDTVYLPASPARIVDTTGAGDALCAAYLAAWLTHEPPVAALQRGLGLAARVVETVGGRPRL